MKKLINDPKTVVDDAARGIAAAHPDLVTVVSDPLYIARVGAPTSGKVGLVSGGGSGHEPLHGGFVGFGMLDAAVPGPVFTSPTPDPIVAATKAVDGGAGVLHIVKNYTGDVLNFETAAELAEADGVTVATVVVDDDVAVKDSLYTAGRRGVAGTVLVEKIAGAAAERGDDLAAVAAVAEKVVSRVRSMGVALTPCTVPHAGEPSFTLGEDEIEIGIGIHGEPGRERIALEPADAIVDRVMDAILEDLPFSSGDRVLLFVNGMGGTPLVELYIAFGHAAAVLEEKGITVERTLIGNFVTSLEMQGFSITLLSLDDELVALWDAPVQTAALRWGTLTVTDGAASDELGTAWVRSWIEGCAAVVAENRMALIALDREIGDGDHGENLDRGFTAILPKLEELPDDAAPSDVLKLVATTLISTVGGAAGPLFGTAFLKAAGAVAGRPTLDGGGIAALLAAARDGIVLRGKAEVGDKTMIDAWTPAVDAARDAAEGGGSAAAVLEAAAEAAEAGAVATEPLVARKGRASYLGERAVGHRDPGSQSTALILRVAAETARA